jgi:lysophospholipase L1-like esterase
MLRNFIVLLLFLHLITLYALEVSAASGGRVVPEEVEIQFEVDAWRLHIPAGTAGVVEVPYVPEPKSVTCSPDAAAVPYTYDTGILRIQSTDFNTDKQPCDVILKWQESRWTKTIQDFEAVDKTIPPMTDGLLFTGSSTARMWDVKKFFPDGNTLNRGFGGSQYWDLICFADAIIGKHRPDYIIVYSGSNDINAGKSPEWVAADCLTAVERLRRAAPQSRIIVLGAGPSSSRWQLYPAMQTANGLIEQHLKGLEQVYFLDLGPLLLGTDGKPVQNYYLEDALHLSEAGYRLWTNALLDFLRNTGK